MTRFGQAGMWPAAVLSLSTALLMAPEARAAAGDPLLLKIQVVEGEGESYAVNSRATRGITVLVSDETGRPVEGATVSFMLPMSGPGGAFANGTHTEITTTRADGRTAVWGMRWNGTPGPFEIRITAVKGQARAGTVAAQYLTEAVGPSGSSTAAAGRNSPATAGSRIPRASSGGHKWLWISLGVAGAAAAGASFVQKGSAGSGSGTQPSGTVTLGTPSITLGRP